uniref:tRNA-binding domain-containing protein n=1 Tax=Chrysotila carterae TaxID=13221 RepID=A0A7S4B163_CHRCT|mmetsp:Transcript_53651/g.116980  ORF Transcript_53651/g.116980 Transcript_53651/m.116980 type:complete len:412 (-) Transcript_53651:283-1518(-)
MSLDAPYAPDNIFAKILRKEIPSHVIFETDHALAILDAFPMVRGHALLIPKAPVVSVLDMSPDVAAKVLAELPRLARAVQHATGAPGVNVLQNSGKEAGQVVFHCHFHVIPRFEGDGAVSKKAPGPMISADEAKSLLSAMRLPFSESLAAVDALISEVADGQVKPPKQAAAAPSPNTKAPRAADKAGSAKAPAATPAKPSGGPPSSTPAADSGTPQSSKGDKKAAKEAKQAAAAAKQPAGGADGDRDVDISWADIRVGVITDAKAHPESPKLYVETIDLGEPEPRTVLSGLAAHMPLEKVKGARVVVICNLKPRKMAGIESQGMVLCASDAEKTALDFVVPPPDAPAGARFEWPGYSGEPETAKKMDKKKAWEAIQPLLRTDDKGRACYKDAPFTVASGSCTSSLKNGIIS